MNLNFQIMEMFQQFFKNPRIRGKSSVFQSVSTEMEANFVLSQKGTNLLKDDEKYLYNKYKENKNNLACLSVCLFVSNKRQDG